ncbi:MAG: hypothetical protein V3V10_03435 [Planctomycetota bacterium]
MPDTVKLVNYNNKQLVDVYQERWSPSGADSEWIELGRPIVKREKSLDELDQEFFRYAYDTVKDTEVLRIRREGAWKITLILGYNEGFEKMLLEIPSSERGSQETRDTLLKERLVCVLRERE